MVRSHQHVEFAGLEEEDSDLHLPNPNAEKANSQHGDSLEVLLATKNKRIVEELTKLRVCRGLDFALGICSHGNFLFWSWHTGYSMLYISCA